MPLLYETGMYRWTWPNVVVTCPEALQVDIIMVAAAQRCSGGVKTAAA